jgi:hypothetical protein
MCTPFARLKHFLGHFRPIGTTYANLMKVENDTVLNLKELNFTTLSLL